MKIYLNNKLYISRKDIFYVLTHERDLANSIREEIFHANNDVESFVVNSENKDEFLVLSSDEAKVYFKKIDYILNFGSYVKYDVDYLEKLLVTVSDHRIDLLDSFVEFDESEKITHLGLRKQIDDLNVFLVSLNDLIEIKKNESRIILPKKKRRNTYREKEEKAKQFLIKMMQPIKYY